MGSACLPASWYCFMLKLRSRVFIYRSKRWSIELLLKICSGAQHLQVLLFQEIVCATTGKLSCNLCAGQVMLIRNYRISGGQGYAQCCMIEHSFKMSCMQLVAHVPQFRNPCASVIKVFSKCFSPYQIFPPKPGLTLMVSSKSQLCLSRAEAEVVAHVILVGATAFSGYLIIFPVGHAAIST